LSKAKRVVISSLGTGGQDLSAMASAADSS
jgi:hypothetical protein